MLYAFPYWGPVRAGPFSFQNCGYRRTSSRRAFERLAGNEVSVDRLAAERRRRQAVLSRKPHDSIGNFPLEADGDGGLFEIDHRGLRHRGLPNKKGTEQRFPAGRCLGWLVCKACGVGTSHLQVRTPIRLVVQCESTGSVRDAHWMWWQHRGTAPT